MNGPNLCNRVRKARWLAISAAAAGVVSAGACGDPNGLNDDPDRLVRINAFPTKVTPGGQALITVTTTKECAAAACTLCIGVPPFTGSGEVFIAGVSGGPQNIVSITGTAASLDQHVVYKAPNTEGSEVITAWLFDTVQPCAPPHSDAGPGASSSLVHLTASASVRITISNASAMQEAGTSSSDASTDASSSSTDASDAASQTDATNATDAADEGG
jgi:hypothetical protein